MNKLELLNQAFIEARKANNATGKALFSTFKGAYENERKSSAKSDDVIIESIAKKFTENAKLMKNNEEVELLKTFMPKEVEDSQYYISINDVLTNNLEKVKEYKSGKTQLIGFFMGATLKDLKSKFPTSDANADTLKELLNKSLNLVTA